MIFASELAAHVGLEVANTTHLHQGGGEESTQTDVQDETALDDLDDGAGNDAVLLLDALDGAPGALVLRALLAQEQTPFLVLLLQARASISSPTETISSGSTSCFDGTARERG